MNKEELFDYEQIWSIIRKTDLLNHQEKTKLHLFLLTFKDNYESLQKRINKAIEILKLCNTQCAKETIEILKGDLDERD